ncbi:MAG: spore gernimation protein [Firmicutes bacterium]|nr:spore gernimation protein [Bacillota bacterium]
MAEFKISNRQFMVLIFLQIMGLVLSPGIWTGIAKQDGWLAELVGIVLGLLVLWLFSRVANLNSELNLIGLMGVIFGKPIGKTVTLCFIFAEFIAVSINVWLTATFITTQILPQTPKQAIMILLIAILIIGVRLGLETIAQVAEIEYSLGKYSAGIGAWNNSGCKGRTGIHNDFELFAVAFSTASSVLY